MKKSTRLAAIVAAMAVTTSMVLAGCGNSSSGSSTASKDNSSGSTTTSESGESGGEVTVGRNGDVWVNANGDEIDISKHVDLTVYTIFGGGGTDTDMVNDAANKLNE